MNNNKIKSTTAKKKWKKKIIWNEHGKGVPHCTMHDDSRLQNTIRTNLQIHPVAVDLV